MAAENLASEQSLGEIEEFDHDRQLLDSEIQADSDGFLPTADGLASTAGFDPGDGHQCQLAGTDAAHVLSESVYGFRHVNLLLTPKKRKR